MERTSWFPQIFRPPGRCNGPRCFPLEPLKLLSVSGARGIPTAGPAYVIRNNATPVRTRTSCSGYAPQKNTYLKVGAFIESAPFSNRQYASLHDVCHCGYINEDVSMTKTFSLIERTKLEFGANFFISSIAATGSTRDFAVRQNFATYTHASATRAIQFHLRISFRLIAAMRIERRYPAAALLLALRSLGTIVGAEPPRLTDDYQVFQRDKNNQATCWIVLPERMKGARKAHVDVTHADGSVLRTQDLEVSTSPQGEKRVLLQGLPVGGPYRVDIAPAAGSLDRLSFHNILVGDLWILAGQSNMFGFNVPDEELPALPYANMLNIMHFLREANWSAGIPPIHRAHEKGMANFLRLRQNLTEDQIKEWIEHRRPVGGIDCSYFFAKQLYAESGVPIGFLPCAIGAALAIWDPDQREKNRYGFMLQHVMKSGGRVKGLLWFQGEQEAIYGAEDRTLTKPSLIYPIANYGREFKKFVEAIRKDVDDPQMPVILAQIGRHHQGEKTRHVYWERMREIQRLIPEQMHNAHTVPTVDLESFDGIHLDYGAYKRLGRRMAYVALPYVKSGAEPRSEVKLRSVKFSETPLAKPRGGEYPIDVSFDGVTRKLTAPGAATGFRLREKATGEDVDWIYAVQLDPKRPDTVILNWRLPPSKSKPAEYKKWDVLLLYGPGAAPYVNITDENDMALPAFGPIEVK
jgi:sialate O-acetylesterase